jgi:uncharacterized protein (TIGR03083 family)
MHSAELDALTSQIGALVQLVDDLPDDAFARPSRCPGWRVSELVAHCEGMLIRLVGANADPYSAEPEIDRVGYYRYDPVGPREGEDPARTFSDVIRDRVIEEVGDRTGAQLQSGLGTAAHGALNGIEDIPGERVIKRSGHPPMTFSEFVASRNLEFGVHTMDIAQAVGRAEEVQPAAAVVIAGILDGLLGEPIPDSLAWPRDTYILTGTGRRELTPDESKALGPLADRFPLLS